MYYGILLLSILSVLYVLPVLPVLSVLFGMHLPICLLALLVLTLLSSGLARVETGV